MAKYRVINIQLNTMIKYMDENLQRKYNSFFYGRTKKKKEFDFNSRK